MNYALIGDIHSQLAPLQQALGFCRQRGLTPVLLGDLFDSRPLNSDSVGVYRAVREAQESMGAVVLRSNHQNKLERHIRGNNVYVGNGLERTLEDFNEGGVPLEEVNEWLDSFPYGVVFKDSNGLEYRCAHALFPKEILISPYEGMYKVMQVTKSSRELMLYGPSSKGGEAKNGFPSRAEWWNKPHGGEWVRVAGHYHTVFISDHSLVLDGGMGGSFHDAESESEAGVDKLCLWDVESRELHCFGDK